MGRTLLETPMGAVVLAVAVVFLTLRLRAQQRERGERL